VAGDRLDSAGDAFDVVHPTASWIWKDPRTCVTAPFWRTALRQRLVFLLAVRHPLAVAASLSKRSGLTTEGGIAVWEGYMARAARAAAGAPVLVCSYEAMLYDPLGFAESSQAFLLEQGIELDPRGNPALAAQSVEQTLAHHRDSDGDALTGEQAALFETLTNLVGPHQCFDPELPPITAATERLFDERRRMLLPADRRGASDPLPPSGIELVKRAPNPPDGMPSISVVIAARQLGSPIEATLDAVLATAPASAEVFVVGQPDERLDPRITVLDGSEGGRVGAIRTAVAQARGEVVMLCDGGAEPNPGWPELLTDALKRSDVGIVGPALLHGTGDAVHGLTFRDACLNVGWVTGAPKASDPFPVAVVPGTMMAFRREVLDAVGGFDPGMIGSGGADTELCIRLWRAGYQCLNVPRASAVVRPDLGNSDAADPFVFLHNRLRLGLLHLSPPRLRQFLEPFRRNPQFAEAFARVIASGFGDRRALIEAISCFDDGWFLRRFNVTALGPEPDTDSIDRREHELVHA
jgi:GT2 family glycosyltransferase